ncbi:MAG: pyridoxamine 5'-phosphate oxidase family protein [Theionarchaea archaeon]|nr:pyridoxamine 5'-phosphate oxidase family protein [Theionarchaea archaeon]
MKNNYGGKMFAREVLAFLEKPRIARFATIGRDGYPHLVTMYFMLDGDDIIMGSDRGERKVQNAEATPKGAVIIGGDPGIDEAGYLIQGDLSIEDDVGHNMTLRMLYRYETEEDAEKHAAEWADSDLVVIRLKPKSVIRVY